MNATTLLDLIDTAEARSPAARALAIAEFAEPALSIGDGALALSIGARNERILRARQALLGDTLECRATCLACAEALEFTVSATALLAEAPQVMVDVPFTLADGELTITARLPTVGDLLAVEASADPRQALISCCVLVANVNGDQVDVALLPEATLSALEAAVRTRDPLIETSFDLTCPACAHHWQSPFDVAAFVWSELAWHAARLIGEVDALARAYGWSEREILAMSARRRQRYLEQLS